MLLYPAEFQDWQPAPALANLITTGVLLDQSWHNDVCPSFIKASDEAKDNEQRPILWADYEDTALREFEAQAKRYTVTQGEETLAQTDDLTEALRAMGVAL